MAESNTNHSNVSRREPLIALTMSLLCPGAGQIYCGRLVAGLVIFFATLMLAPIVTGASLLSAGPSTFLLIATTMAFLAVYVYSTVDAFRLARQSGSEFQIQPCNHPLVYLGLIVGGAANSVVSLFLLRTTVFAAYLIATNSMAPSLVDGDRVLVNKMFSQRAMPERGELVVFLNPEDRRRVFVKRVIGLPGDVVETRGSQVLLNGKLLGRDPLPKESCHLPESLLDGAVYEEEIAGHRYSVLIGSGKSKIKDQKYEVPAGHCFVLGDNRGLSLDSRHFSYVALGNIVGEVQAMVWPQHDWRRFGTVD